MVDIAHLIIAKINKIVEKESFLLAYTS